MYNMTQKGPSRAVFSPERSLFDFLIILLSRKALLLVIILWFGCNGAALCSLALLCLLLCVDLITFGLLIDNFGAIKSLCVLFNQFA